MACVYCIVYTTLAARRLVSVSVWAKAWPTDWRTHPLKESWLTTKDIKAYWCEMKLNIEQDNVQNVRYCRPRQDYTRGGFDCFHPFKSHQCYRIAYDTWGRERERKTRPTAISRVLLEQYLIKYTKNSEMYASLRNIRKSHKWTEVSEMYSKTSVHQNSSKITEKVKKPNWLRTNQQTDQQTDRHSDL